ncbi:hypothetical protein F4861DRAFT_130451 [Xylaria intraflava]|nr:hypothetical protein F4861DRAFT_130451 [Xylaria intraflava]
MAAGDYPSFLSAKRQSGEYTDFTLVCQGQELRVHKLVVCGQSPMMAAAVRNNFAVCLPRLRHSLVPAPHEYEQEAKVETLEVNFGLAPCQLMLDFMYTGNYALPDEPEARPSQLLDRLQRHMEVNIIADYYGVDFLCELSATKIREAIKAEWSADIFTVMLEIGFRQTMNLTFYQMAAEMTAVHNAELSEHSGFLQLDFPAKFTAQLVHAIPTVVGKELLRPKYSKDYTATRFSPYQL